MTSLQTHLLGCALLLRLALLVYGELQDRFMSVKYTDVDYDVYSDAAREVAAGNSPFDRTTYRYTPVLYVAVTVRIIVPRLALPPVLDQHLDARQRGLDRRAAGATHAALPHAKAARFGGGHFLNGEYNKANAKWSSSCQSSFCFWVKLGALFNRDRVLFGLISGGFFLALTAAFYKLHFLYEAYLYHLTRTDNRHNFSVYFYDLYLRYGTPSGFGVGLLAFLPQLASLVTISLTYGEDISFALFALTMVFVIFNKVCTAQYFVWYTAFLPLIFPMTSVRLRWKGALMVAAWFGSELHWLFWAFHLEMKGENTFFRLWLAGLAFFAVNIGILATLMRHHTYSPLFSNGHIVQLVPNNNSDSDSKAKEE